MKKSLNTVPEVPAPSTANALSREPMPQNQSGMPVEASRIERHLNDCRRSTAERLVQFPQVKDGPDPSCPRPAKDAFETDSSSNQARNLDWVLIAVLIFVVFSWVAFCFCLWVILARVRG